MARTYKTVGFSIPPAIAERIERTAKARNMTRSELFREMFRVWEKDALLDPDSDEAILKLAAEEKEKERLNPTTVEERLREFEEIRRNLLERAQSLGIIVTEDGEILEKEQV